MTKQFDPLTLFVMGVVHHRKNAPRKPWNPIRGWKRLLGRESLPSITRELFNIYRKHSIHMTVQKLWHVVTRVGAFRAVITLHIDDYSPLCGVIFCTPSGSILIVFPRHDDMYTYGLSIYTMGETTQEHCYEVGTELVQAFHERILRRKALPPNNFRRVKK